MKKTAFIVLLGALLLPMSLNAQKIILAPVEQAFVSMPDTLFPYITGNTNRLDFLYSTTPKQNNLNGTSSMIQRTPAMLKAQVSPTCVYTLLCKDGQYLLLREYSEGGCHISIRSAYDTDWHLLEQEIKDFQAAAADSTQYAR